MVISIERINDSEIGIILVFEEVVVATFYTLFNNFFFIKIESEIKRRH